MTVYFIGWYGQRNSGDESFKLAHRALFPGEHIEWLTTAALPQIGKGDVVVLGSGDVLRDFYLRLIPDGVKYFVYGVGADGQADLDVAVAQKERIIAGWFRNYGDVEYLRAHGVHAHYTPDIVFQLAPPENGLAIPSSPQPRKTMTCFFSNDTSQYALETADLNLFARTYTQKREIAQSLDQLSPYYNFRFVPFSFAWNAYDLSFAVDVFAMMKRRENVKIVEEELAFDQVMYEVSTSHVVVSMKFHGLIYAVLAKRPFVNIGLTHKTQQFCLEAGLEELSVSPIAFTAEKFLTSLKIAEAPKTLEKVVEVSAKYRANAVDAGMQFAESLNRHRTSQLDL
ncbi:polysaccharide pyruvyl transferase family protein [Pararhizobium qamdonense]|uniref:polysaccharide pyruvyl transferase family protein n=1 Tax=Pararhizobium qamdonense TaxID=3031126 RepID=UPI0023E31FAA|nr:polysaccharide pyruvyl transferase family protein [Pararhizobium qamdonense]